MKTSSSTKSSSARDEKALLRPCLKAVSRSFYLSLRVLPRPMRTPVSLAYLLARTADSIADASECPEGERLALLKQFRSCLFEHSATATASPPRRLASLAQNVSAFAAGLHLEAEAQLLRSTDTMFSLLQKQKPPFVELVCSVAATLTKGMLFDFEHFAGASAAAPAALATRQDLDLYTYLVAGCVGEFWTRTAVQAGCIPQDRETQLIERGIRYGKGLQLINILRDMPSDLERHRIYIPIEMLSEQGLSPEEVGKEKTAGHLAPIVDALIQQTRTHLKSGHEYVCTLPRRAYRLRLASLWPLWIGLCTVEDLAACGNLFAEAPVRIQRKKVYRLLARSLLCSPSNLLLERTYRRLSGEPSMEATNCRNSGQNC